MSQMVSTRTAYGEALLHLARGGHDIYAIAADTSQSMGISILQKEFPKRCFEVGIAGIFIAIAERFEHSVIFFHSNPNTDEETIRLMDIILERTGDKYFLMMHGGGYIFSTSNCVYTGMALARYELMLSVWRQEGNYDMYTKQGL